jgi:methionyl-tRNA formyltransferase
VIFVEARAMPSDEPNGAEAGTITDDLTVNVPDGVVEILQLKVAGKRTMRWRDFVNGYRVAAGDRFACPQEGDRG